MEQYRQEARTPWYMSFWVLLVVVGMVVLVIAWSSSRHSPSDLEQAQAPSAEVTPGSTQSAPQQSPADQPQQGQFGQADHAVPI